MPKNLQDLVRGLRGASNESEYISDCLIDIHEECKSKKTSDKVEAISKLTFLYLLGYDIKPYAFNTIECMSSSDPIIKRTGYLASVFSFGSPDMQTLSTNLYVNDLKSKYLQIKNMALASLASCPAPNREQVHTIVPILFEQLNTAGNTMTNIPLVIKMIATTVRVLVLAKRQEIEGTLDFVPDFVEILYNLASAGNLTKDVIITQVYCHCALEIGRNFGQDQVMRLIPSLYDILLTAKQPWILIEVSRFFGFMAVYDTRVKAKVREQFLMLLNATESKSLLMELAKAIAEGYQDDMELVRHCTKRMADFIIPGAARSDSNLKILALKNLAVLERATPGAIMRIDGLPNEVIQVLDDKDFNLRIVALTVIGSMANQQLLENIVNRLLICLREARQMSKGKSLKELHQVSASDVLVFKKKVVEVVLDMCSRDNYANVTDFSWFVDVLITLSMEYPQISADECAQKLLDLALKSDDLKAVAPKLVSIILKNQSFLDTAGLTVFDQPQVQSLSLYGPVVDQPFPTIAQEIDTMNKLLGSKFGSSQTQTKEIVEAIGLKLMMLPKNGPLLQAFGQQFFKIMEDNGAVYKRFYQDKVILSTASRQLYDEELSTIRSVSNLLSVAAWVMGSFLCYQPAGDDALNLYECLETLLPKSLKHLSTDTAAVFITSAFKAFIGLLYSYNSNNMLTDEATCSSCMTEGYFKDFLVTKDLTDAEITSLKAQLIRERNERNQDVDRTFLSDAERAALDAEPEVDEVQAQLCTSLLNMFVKSMDLLASKLKEFSLVPGLHALCDQLYFLLKNQAELLRTQVSNVDDAELKEELTRILGRFVVAENHNEHVLEPTLENLGASLLQMIPDEQIIQQRAVPRPEFAFDNGSLFSLDMPEGAFLTTYDFEEFQPEELTNQAMERQRHKRRVQGEPEAQQSIFSEFVNQQVQEIEVAPEATQAPNLQGEAAQIFTPTQQKPVVKSAFYLDKSKLAKADKTVQLGKYTAGLNLGLNTAKPAVANVAIAEGQRRRKHKRHEEEQPAIQFEATQDAVVNEAAAPQPVQQPQPQAQPVAEPVAVSAPAPAPSAADDLAALFM